MARRTRRQKKNVKTTKNRPLIITLIVVTLIGGALWSQISRDHSSSKNTSSSADKKTESKKMASSSFNKELFSLKDPRSIWVIVNKQNPLNPKNFKPNDLVEPDITVRVPGNVTMKVRKPTGEALETMFARAEIEGLNFMLASGYRSYDYQVGLYDSYVSHQGQSAADTFSARAGYSEHQTGLVADVGVADGTCELDGCFAETPEGVWLINNSHLYGFIIRYPKNKELITGYKYEPWHLRYVGVPLATEMKKQNITTLEEFFGLAPAPNYKR